jgi:DNA-binding NarL/FixJ family response regulator
VNVIDVATPSSRPHSGASANLGNRTQPLRVMVVSSNYMTRAGLRVILDAHPDILLLGELARGTNAVEIVGQEKPDVIVIDLDLTGGDASDLIRKFRAAAKDTHILILCGLNNEHLTREALSSGAAGVVLKIQPAAVLFAAIKGLYDRIPTFISSSQPTKILTNVTTRERDVIALIGAGLRNKDIAARLCISETTVRHHLTSIFSKLDVSSRQKLLIVAHQNGLTKL